MWQLTLLLRTKSVGGEWPTGSLQSASWSTWRNSKCGSRWTTCRLRLRLSGVAVANGRFVGGGFPIAPYALLNNGFMDVTTVPVLPTIELMAAGMNFLLTRDHRNDRVRTYRVKRLHLVSEPPMPFSVDGEPIRPFDATFEVMPAALRIVTGVAPPALLRGLDEDETDPETIPRLLA